MDTLATSGISALKDHPVIHPAEQVRLRDAVAPPSQVAAVLSRFTGIQLKDYGGAGGLKTVNVRSLGSEHVGIFLDGIQIDNAQNMQVDLGRFSTDNLEAVSLYNGQKTRRLQTAKEYAAGASVYLESIRPALTTPAEWRIRLRGGSFGTFNPSIQYTRAIRKTALRASAEYLTSNGKYKFPCFDTTLIRQNGDIRALRMESQLYGGTNGGSWQAHLYTYRSERGFPGPVIRRGAGLPFSAERQDDRDIFVQGSWNEEWTDRYATGIRLKYSNNYTHYDTRPDKNPAALPYNLHYRQQSAYFSLAQSCTITGPWSADLSTDIQYNTLASDAGQFVSPRRITFTGAIATKLAWENIRAAASLVYQGARDIFRTPQAGGWTRENAFRDAWTPSLSLFWRPRPWIEADAFVKRSYRLPTFNDLYYTLVGNADLAPESAFQAGADLKGSWQKGACRIEARISPYYNNVSDKIVAIPTASQFRWTMLNIGVVDITGADTRLGMRLHDSPDFPGWVLELTFRYSFQQALDHSTPGSLTYGNQIPYVPRHSGGAGCVARWKDWSLVWDTMATGGRWSRTANTPDYYIGPWSVSDVELSKTFRVAGAVLSASLRCNNLFGRHYQIVQGYPMPGRNWSCHLSYGF